MSFMKAGDDADDDDGDGDDDADDVAFWCFEEKGGVGELWAGVAAAGRELLCYSLALPPGCSLSLCKICSALRHMRASFILLARGDTGTNMEANSGEILAKKRGSR